MGYFTLALKPLTIRGKTVSNTTKRKLLRISELDENSDTYNRVAYLIAQLGKNYTDGANTKITGKELVELAWNVIEDAQYMLGGIVVFLEAENEEKISIKQTVSRSLTPGRPYQMQMSRMSWYSF